MRSVVKKIVCNDRIIALKLKVEPVSVLTVQVYVPTWEYEDDEVEEILEEDGKDAKNTIIMKNWNNVAGHKAYRNFVGSHGLRRRN
jgi:hypothetical protein